MELTLGRYLLNGLLKNVTEIDLLKLTSLLRNGNVFQRSASTISSINSLTFFHLPLCPTMPGIILQLPNDS